MTAFASSVLILTSGYLLSTDHQLDVEVLSILLSFPAAAASLIVMNRDTGPIGGTVAARLGSLVTFTLSVLSAVVALGIPLFNQAFGSMELFKITGQWFVLSSLSVVNTICLAASYRRRSMLYGRVLNRRESAL